MFLQKLFAHKLTNQKLYMLSVFRSCPVSMNRNLKAKISENHCGFIATSLETKVQIDAKLRKGMVGPLSCN